MKNILNGKTALVTGGGRGIGARNSHQAGKPGGKHLYLRPHTCPPGTYGRTGPQRRRTK